MKIRANFWIQEDAKLKPHSDKGTSYSWHAYDSSEDPPTIDQLCARFGSEEKAKLFEEVFNAARLFNIKSKTGCADSDLTFAPQIEDIRVARVEEMDNVAADQDEDEEAVSVPVVKQAAFNFEQKKTEEAPKKEIIKE